MKFHSIFIILFSLTFISSCDESSENNNITVIKGGKTYGGELKFMSSDKVQGLFPLAVIDKYSFSITAQIFESLVKINLSTLEVEPSLAESWEVNENGDVYTFKIRSGVYFHEDECLGGTREMKPADVKFSLDFACSALPMNKVGNALGHKIKGGRTFFQNSQNTMPQNGVSGIKIKGKNAIEITLNKPFVGFEKILSQPNIVVFPKESYEKYKTELPNHPVGTGPFILSEKSDDGIKLTRNNSYWRKDDFGNQLPYLNALSISYTSDKKSEMMAFRQKEIDLLLEIPVLEIENVLGTLLEAKQGKNVKHRVESSFSLSMEYIGFNHESPVFKKKQVRQAFMLAINPAEIIDTKLGGAGYPPTNGFIPEMAVLNNRIRTPSFDPEKARSLLAAAGYPSGKGFPNLNIYVNALKDSKIHRLMEGIVEHLNQELNISLNIKLCNYAQREAAIKSGEAHIWRAGWIADYPDASSFLGILYGHGTTSNAFRLADPRFDENFDKASVEKSQKARDALLVNCAQQVVDDAFLLPVFNDNMLIMVNARVRGVVANPVEIIDFTEVFIKEPRKISS